MAATSRDPSNTIPVALDADGVQAVKPMPLTDWPRFNIDTGFSHGFVPVEAIPGGGMSIPVPGGPGLPVIVDAWGNVIGWGDDGTPGTPGTAPVLPLPPTISPDIDPVDDYPSDSSTSSVKAVGATIRGTLETRGDGDLHRLVVTMHTMVFIKPDGFNVGVVTANGLYGPHPVGLAWNSDRSTAWFFVADSRSYFVEVEGGPLGKTGAYALATGVMVDDFAGDRTTSGVLAVGGTVTGMSTAFNDSDWFKMSLEAGVAYDIKLAGLEDNPANKFYELADADGNWLASAADVPYIAPVSGTYYMAVDARGAGATYTATLKKIADDRPAGMTGSLAVNGQSPGRLDYYGDIDWFTLDVEAGKSYVVEVDSAFAYPNNSLQTHLNLILNDAAGTKVPGSHKLYFTPENNVALRFQAPADATYQVGVIGGAHRGLETAPESYVLKALAAQPDNAGDQAADAAVLKSGEVHNGSFEVIDDIDVFKVTLPALSKFKVTLGGDLLGQGPSYGIPLTYTVTDPGGYQNPGSIGSTERAYKGGDYLISVRSPMSLMGKYTVEVNTVGDEIGASATAAHPLAVATSYLGELETVDDHDWFAIQMTAGTTYWMQLSTSGVQSSRTYGAAMQLRDAQGVVVKQVLPSTESFDTLSFMPSTTGTYYLDTSTPHVAPMTYGLRVVVGQADDHGDMPAAATATGIGQAVTGKFEHSRDVDAFKFTLEGGSYYTLNPGNADITFRLDESVSVLRLLPDGTSEPLKFTHGANVPLLKIDHTGDYAVTLKRPDNSNNTAYTLQIDKAFADDHPDTIATTSVLPVGGRVIGAIEARKDVDVFKLSLEANHTYMLTNVLPGDMNGRNASLFDNSKLVLSDAGGNELASSSMFYRPHHLTFTAPASGTYHLAYTHSYDSFRSVNNYTLRAADITADTRKPMLTLLNADEIGKRGPILLEADEFLNAKGPGEYLNANGSFLLRDADGNSVEVSAYPMDFSTHSVLGISPDIELRPGTTYTLALGDGAVADYAGNYVAPVVYTFTVSGSRLSMAVHGGAGNDTLHYSDLRGSLFFGRAGDDTMHGSLHVDTSLYTGNRGLYTITKNGGSITVASDIEGRDTLNGIERLEFADRVITYDHTGLEGQGYRMYRAVFNREPDAAGLGFYVKLLETGYTLYTISPFFVASPEFQGLYGSNPGNRDFVERLYQNVLHRAGEAEGMTFWVDLLDRQVLTQSQVVVGFSESPENVAATAALIGNGFEYIPYA